jgi:hypothetical protein
MPTMAEGNIRPMITLRCTRKLLERLAVPADTESDAVAGNALGDWYANLVRVGREQLVVAMNERTYLTLVLPAKGARHSLPGGLTRMFAMLMRELEVPEDAIGREVAAMQPMAYARTSNRSTVAALNERAKLVDHVWRDDRMPMDIMTLLARVPFTSGPAQADFNAIGAARRLLGLDPKGIVPETVVRLRVSLRDLSPAIWRRILVPATITLPHLHRALQIAMGWKDYHLHEFDFGGVRYGLPDDDWPIEGLREERDVRLGALLRERQVDRFTYTYDYGDEWVHDVAIEAIEPNTESVRGVHCLGGANACPPEDVGGPAGYLDLLEALRDPAHEQHREMIEWVGGEGFDPAAFDVGLANALLDAEFGR